MGAVPAVKRFHRKTCTETEHPEGEGTDRQTDRQTDGDTVKGERVRGLGLGLGLGCT